VKRLLLILASQTALLVAVVVVQPASWLFWHQPDTPEELRRVK
jgi:cyclic lactone autoinducer peptide